MHFRVPQWYDSLPSTNTRLMELLNAGGSVVAGTVLAARMQTAGRGRGQHCWSSVPGQDLTFSLALYTRRPPRQALSAPMAAALGVAAALEEIFGLSVRTKWPNDLLVRQRKICGILAERSGAWLVVGIGLNVNMTAVHAATIDRPVTSMRMETGACYAVEAVLEQVLGALEPWLNSWEEGGFAAIRTQWLNSCAFLGEWVEMSAGAGACSGRLVDFGSCGQALLAQADGHVLEAWGGDMSAP